MFVNLLNRLTKTIKNKSVQFLLDKIRAVIGRGALIIASKKWLSLVVLFASFILQDQTYANEAAWNVTSIKGRPSFPTAELSCRDAFEYHKSLYGHLVAYRFDRLEVYRGLNYGCYFSVFNGRWLSDRFRGYGRCAKGDNYDNQSDSCVGPDPISSSKGSPPDNQSCPASTSGSRINFATGNNFQQEPDYRTNSPSPLEFIRAYNSIDGVWRHKYSTYLRFTGTSYLSLVMADGRESFFTISGSTVAASPTELGHLTKAADTWLYTAKNNDTYNFDATGRLTRWTNTAGAEHLLTYVNGTITVTDNLGQSLSFTEDAQHQPLTLSTAGLAIQYDYTNQRLSKLTRTRGGQTEQRLFHYDPNNKNLLTGITDERGVRFTTWTFDDQGRATSSEHAGKVEHTDVTYNADGSSTVTNEFGKKSIYRFVTIDGVKRVSAIEGEALGSCPMSNSTFTYDTRGLLKTKTDNKGFVTTYDYNTRGLETSRTEATGTPQARTTTTTWHVTLNLPLTVTEPGRVITYTYDTQGRQLSQTSASTAP